VHDESEIARLAATVELAYLGRVEEPTDAECRLLICWTTGFRRTSGSSGSTEACGAVQFKRQVIYEHFPPGPQAPGVAAVDQRRTP
jgi:hypothetical protein